MSLIASGARSATEMQSVATLRAARDVAASIEGMRQKLKDDELPDRQRQRLKDDLLEAAERLCNLLDLLMSWLSMVSDAIRTPLEEGIQELRNKLLGTAVKLIADKAQRLIDQTAFIEQGFPLGLSFRLITSLSELMSTVTALGGFEAMPDEVRQKLIEAEERIEALRQMEEQFCFSAELEEKTDLDYYDGSYSGAAPGLDSHQPALGAHQMEG